MDTQKKQPDIIDYIGSISLALILLIVMEAVCTMGNAFKFDQYNWFGFVLQSLVVIATICWTIKIIQSEK